MREILFRGKRIDNGEWVEGWLVIKKDPVLETTYCFILAYGKGESFVTWYPVEPDTVGQYTGLTDKNRKKIFEGDIIAIERGWGECVRYTVEYDTALCAFIGNSINYVGFTTLEDIGNRGEIIGNIHDNPDFDLRGAGA